MIFFVQSRLIAVLIKSGLSGRLLTISRRLTTAGGGLTQNKEKDNTL